MWVGVRDVREPVRNAGRAGASSFGQRRRSDHAAALPGAQTPQAQGLRPQSRARRVGDRTHRHRHETETRRR